MGYDLGGAFIPYRALPLAMREAVVTVQELRGMALHRKFIVAMMLAYAVVMAGVTVLLAANGQVAAVGTAVVGLAVGIAAVTVVPARLGS